MSNIIIVGGGVAGMIAAITAANNGNKVTILEKNSELGKKILITGNGRCNFTNEYMKGDCYSSSLNNNDEVSRHITREFADVVLDRFNNKDFIKVLSDLGMSYYVREGYYYPKTDEARTFRDTLVSEVNRLGIEVVYNFNLRSIERNEDGFILSNKEQEYTGGKVIIAAGGNAAPKTGSSGDCYYYLEKLGHNIFKAKPALTNLKADYPDDLQGVNALANLSIRINGKILETDDTALEINDKTIKTNAATIKTEKGFIKYYKGMLSGIPIYQLSMEAIPALELGGKVEIVADFATDSNIEAALKLQGTTLKEALYKSINPKIVDVILKGHNIAPDTLTNNMNVAEREHIIELFSSVNYEIIGFGGFENAQATLGGVDIREINPQTMESKICKGLYFAGEIMDIVGICGGYNIQWAASTGTIAGINV